MRPLFTFASTACLALGACSGGSDQARQEPVTAPSPNIAPDSPAAKLTPAFLKGPWCYVRHEAGGEVSEENITYDFAADGSLKYQISPDAPVDMDGSYEFDDGIFVVKPALALFKFVPVAVDENAMVLEAMGAQAFWARGVCGAVQEAE